MVSVLVFLTVFLIILAWLLLRWPFVFQTDWKGNLSDPMLVSGVALSVIGLTAAAYQERFFTDVIFNLSQNGIIRLDPDSRQRMAGDLWRRHFAYSLAGGVFIAVVVFAGYWLSGFVDFDASSEMIEFWLASTLIGFAAGHRLGASAAFGRLVHWLRRHENELRIIVGHKDGSGGASPAGNFFAYQGAFISLIVLFLIAWLILIRVVGYKADAYSQWNDHFLVLLLIALVFLVLGSLLPIYRLRKLMSTLKAPLEIRISRAHERIVALNDKFQKNQNWRSQDIKELQLLQAEIEMVESIRLLPLTKSWRRLVGLNSFLPLAGMALEYSTGKSSSLGELFQAFTGAG